MACYNGLTCHNNYTTKSHTVHAVAYIPKTHATLTLKSISYKLKGFLTQAQVFPDQTAAGYALYLHRCNEPKQYRLELFGKKRKSVTFSLTNNQCTFNDSIDFVGKVSLELFENDTPKGFYAAFNNKSRNLDTQQIPALYVKGGHVNFETPKGIFRLEYDVKTHP
jgi:hypothetical protein